MLRILLIGYQYQEPNGFISKGDIVGIQALNQQHLPSIQTLLIQFYKLMQATNSKIFHVIIAVIKELIDGHHGLLDQVGRRVDVTYRLDCLLKNAFVEMHG
jgi:hypothetical protein